MVFNVYWNRENYDVRNIVLEVEITVVMHNLVALGYLRECMVGF